MVDAAGTLRNGQREVHYNRREADLRPGVFTVKFLLDVPEKFRSTNWQTSLNEFNDAVFVPKEANPHKLAELRPIEKKNVVDYEAQASAHRECLPETTQI